MSTRKKAAAKPAAPKSKAPAEATQPDQSADAAHAARMETMKPDQPPAQGQTTTVSKAD